MENKKIISTKETKYEKKVTGYHKTLTSNNYLGLFTVNLV